MNRLECNRMFIAIMELGSFVKAAENLNTSVAQASKLISKLENELGVQLLKRSTRSLTPTELGQAYYHRIKQLMAEFDELDISIKNQSSFPVGRLKISAPNSFGTVQLSPTLIKFAQRYNEIELDVSFNDRTVNLIEEGFDVAIRIGQLKDNNLIATQISQIKFLLVASPFYLKNFGTPRKLQDLQLHQCIIDTNFKDPYEWSFYENKQPHTISVNGRIHFNNTEACLDATIAGLGIARLPTFILKDAIIDKKVIPILENYELPKRGLYAVYPPAKHLANKVRALIDYLKEQYTDPPEWEKFE
ncbi:LysR family transcriptional regulator [Acinetobacter baumannii]|uniref:LysR family transcriptional regulator n=1 Tax=Acinetobacter calcoaceticus/baumannii complex TaxID=909768 RepID=UPI001E452916|nr:LysR family transcriptional regulator [Acinetobacter pittii]MDC5021073.1 LysR family transcriptional regulator [Acinetobacter baumannii]